MRKGGNGQPSLLARKRMDAFLRRNAAAARTTDVPWAANALRRSSSWDVHGSTKRRMEIAEDYGADRTHNGADQNDDGRFLLGNEWHWFHDR
jgi:hypothetical protein